ncbi:hypothetical protein Tco_0087337 [Tanacetum coccineum]
MQCVQKSCPPIAWTREYSQWLSLFSTITLTLNECGTILRKCIFDGDWDRPFGKATTRGFVEDKIEDQSILELKRKTTCKFSPMQVKFNFFNATSTREWSRFVTVVKQSQELDTVSYHKLFDVLSSTVPQRSNCTIIQASSSNDICNYPDKKLELVDKHLARDNKAKLVMERTKKEEDQMLIRNKHDLLLKDMLEEEGYCF